MRPIVVVTRGLGISKELGWAGCDGCPYSANIRLLLSSWCYQRMGEALEKVFAPLHQGVIPTLKPALWSVKEFTIYHLVLVSRELLTRLFEALGNDVGE